MEKTKLKALVSLLDDEDQEVITHVEEAIILVGDSVIPLLEQEWERNFNPIVQKRIEELIHLLQFQSMKQKLRDWKENESDDLLKGLWLVSLYQYPDLEFEKLKATIEQIYYEAWLELNYTLHPFDQIKLLNEVFFGKMKFSANTKNFHSPSNSMLNIVLESRKGNPISLCAIYMMVAQKLKLPIYGVNLPNLFILTYKTDQTQFYINVFNKGIIFSKADIDNYLSHLNIGTSDIFYEPCENIEIIKRVFRNLIFAYEKVGDLEKIEEIKLLLDSICEPKENPII